MSDESTSARYSRPEVDPQGTDSLSILARWIEPRAEVLDLGASTGVLGRYLVTRGCVVDGVEIDHRAAETARLAYRRLVEANLETTDVESLFEGRRYDAVVCADVLEHLRDPHRLLEQVRRLIKPDGALLISVPNVGYAGVLLELFAGEFTYRPQGILDATHVRFYTRASLVRLLADHGLHPDKIEAVTKSLNESEFGTHLLERIPPSTLKMVTEQTDSLVYQFVLRARLEPSPCAVSVLTPLPLACFAVQLFWAGTSARYSEAQSLVVTAPLDTQIHQLRFALPESPRDVVNLRLDPSDRPGLIFLHSLCEETASGLRRWSWFAGEGPPPVRTLHQLIGIPGPAVPTFVSLGGDPSFEFVLPEGLKREGGGALLVRISLLPTTEALTVAHAFTNATGRFAEAAQRLAAVEQHQAQSGARLGELADRSEALHSALQARLGSVGSQMEGLQSTLEALMVRFLAVETRVTHVDELLERSAARRISRLLRRFRASLGRSRTWTARPSPRRGK